MTTLVLRLTPLPSPDDTADASAPRLVPLRAVDDPAATEPPAELRRWSEAMAETTDGCLLLDRAGRLVAVSPSAADVLGLGADAVGQPLLDRVTLIDFEAGAEQPEYAARIPPLAALRGGGMARSLIRLRRGDGEAITLEAQSTPVHDSAGDVVGSITFIAPA